MCEHFVYHLSGVYSVGKHVHVNCARAIVGLVPELCLVLR